MSILDSMKSTVNSVRKQARSTIKAAPGTVLSSAVGTAIGEIAGQTGLTTLGDLLPPALRQAIAKDPQRSYMFSVYFQGGIAAKLGDIGIYVQSVQIPAVRVEMLKLRRINTSKVYAGKSDTPKQINFVFWDDEGLTVDTFFRTWLSVLTAKMQINNDPNAPLVSGIVSKKDYVSDLVIETKDASDILVTKRYVLKNAFPIEIADTEMSYESNDAMRVQVTIAFDSIEEA